MPTTKVTPKDFFLWAGAMMSLYISVFSFITLFFEYINRAFIDNLTDYVDPYSGTIRFAMASLVVLFPTFLVLMRLIRKDMARDPAKRDIWIRRWALFLTVFFAGAAVAIDLITLINSFLGGDISERFILKVVIVLLVAGAGFLHFLADIKGYWVVNHRRANMVGYGAAALVLATIVSGFIIIGTPGQVRLYRYDEQKVNDLTNIQYQIVNYWQQKQTLPTQLSDLTDPISGYVVPKDPQEGMHYTYSVLRDKTFKICAIFNAVSQNVSEASLVMPKQAAPMGSPGSVSDIANATWQHNAGEYCFVRTIDPSRYPPFPKATK